MATVNADVVREGDWIKMTWTGMATGDTIGAAYLNTNVSDLWMECEGTWGGATIALTGYSYTAAATFAMVDPAGTALSFTADAASPIRDAAPRFKPTISGGTSDSIDVRIWAKVVR